MIDNFSVCIENGIRQGNFNEMVNFYRFATFISYEQLYSKALIKRPIIEACFKCIKVSD